MYRLWLNGLYGLYGPRCPLSSKRLINLISLSLSIYFKQQKFVFAFCIISQHGYSKISWKSFLNEDKDCLIPHCQYHGCWWYWFHSLWPSDAICWHRTGSTLAQVMPDGTKPLPEPLLTNHQGNFTRNTLEICPRFKFENQVIYNYNHISQGPMS